jgi:hypothetical protein
MHSDNGRNGQPKKPAFDLHHDAWGRLVLVEEGCKEHVGVEPVRGFPISDPHRGISLCDAEGHELVWLENLDEVPESLRRLLEESLARREFLPVLQRVLKISTLVEPSAWEVETNRGQTRFILNNEDDVRRLDDHRALVIDANGIRYLIPDLRSLDASSRRMLERYL